MDDDANALGVVGGLLSRVLILAMLTEDGTVVNRIVGKRDSARRSIARKAHGAVLELHQGGNRVPQSHADWHYDLRRGRLCIYGGLLRFIDLSIASGKGHIARQVVSWLDWYVTESLGPTNDAALRKQA